MSINFGYGGYGGHGMMNGTGMMGGMGMMGSGENTFQRIRAQYGCPMCDQYGSVPYNYQTYVNPLPEKAANPSFLTRFIRRFF